MFDVITIGTVTRDTFVRSAAFEILEDARFRTGKAECLNLGSKVDIDELIKHAKKTRTILEIDAEPHRLDLKDDLHLPSPS